jgi:hypothetical protein
MRLMVLPDAAAIVPLLPMLPVAKRVALGLTRISLPVSIPVPNVPLLSVKLPEIDSTLSCVISSW